MIVPERLKAAMQSRGLSQSALARAANISASMVNKLATGHARETAHIYAIAKALKCSPEYLSGEAEAMNGGETGGGADMRASPAAPSFDELAEEAGLVPVREIDLTLGMGATYLDVPVTETIRHFPIEWLRLYTRAAPEHLLFAQGVGDSMEPTLRDSDLLLIDCSQRHLNMSDKIWAIAYAECGAVKRLRPVAGGGVEILSDNPAVPTATAFDGELHILGRVVASVRKM